jgi:hypothetical protein
LERYNGSLFKMLSETYPEYQWIPWKFNHLANGFWSDSKIQRKFMEWVGEQLTYKTPEDWYKIANKVFFQVDISS